MPEDQDALEALAALVAQIELSEFRDELGHRLKMNQAYLDAKALVELMRAAKGAPER
jgi:hypothetical protein